MPSLRRRRARPVKKAAPAPRKKRVVKTRSLPTFKIQWNEATVKILIILFVVVDILFITSAVIRQCSHAEPPQIVEEKIQAPVEEDPHIIQIEILNGCGVPGIAAKFTDYLRSKGIDVVKTDNYMEFGKPKFNIEKSVVIDRRGKIEYGQKVAEYLGLPPSRVLQEVNEAYLIDATFILGSDFRSMTSWSKLEK